MSLGGGGGRALFQLSGLALPQGENGFERSGGEGKGGEAVKGIRMMGDDRASTLASSSLMKGCITRSEL